MKPWLHPTTTTVVLLHNTASVYSIMSISLLEGGSGSVHWAPLEELLRLSINKVSLLWISETFKVGWAGFLEYLFKNLTKPFCSYICFPESWVTTKMSATWLFGYYNFQSHNHPAYPDAGYQLYLYGCSNAPLLQISHLGCWKGWVGIAAISLVSQLFKWVYLDRRGWLGNHCKCLD